MKFLVIQQKMLGDVLSSTVICENLKLFYPSCKVHYVVNENTLDLLWNNHFIDEIITFKNEFRQNKMAFLTFLKGLKKERYDAAFDTYGKLESNLMTIFVNAEYKISHRKWYTQWIYTHTVEKYAAQQRSMPLAVSNRLKLLSPFLGRESKYQCYPKIFLTKKEVQSAAKQIEAVRSYPNQKIIMISIVGSSPSKTYPSDYMSKILDIISKNCKGKMIFNYMPGQKALAMEIFEKCSDKTKWSIDPHFFTPKLRDFIAILSQCSVIIGNEGGAVNMAKALNIPTFCVYSPLIGKGAWHSEARPADIAIHLKDYKPALFTDLKKKSIKKNISRLYNLFQPALFEKRLEDFLKLYCNEKL